MIWSAGSAPGVLIQQFLADGAGKDLYYTKNGLHHSLYDVVFQLAYILHDVVLLLVALLFRHDTEMRKGEEQKNEKKDEKTR